MPHWLIVMEAHSKAPIYEILLDVLERRLGARRILRSAWVIEAESAQAVYDGLSYYRPYNDGLIIIAFSDDRIARNLRDANGERTMADAYPALTPVQQVTPE